MTWNTFNYFQPGCTLALPNPDRQVPIQWSSERPSVFYVSFDGNALAFDLATSTFIPVVGEGTSGKAGAEEIPSAEYKAQSPFVVLRGRSQLGNALFVGTCEHGKITAREISMRWSKNPEGKTEEDELEILRELIHRSV